MAGLNYDAERRAQLVAEKATILKRLSCLHSEMNACVPACQLPPEVLAEIFLCIRQFKSPIAVIRISHVCHLWRTVALECRSLWSFISPCSIFLVSMFVERAGNTPLSLHIHPSSGEEGFEDLLEMIERYTDRFAGVDVELDADEFSYFEEYMTENSWDSLQSLVLAHKQGKGVDVDLSFGGKLPPNLRYLRCTFVVPLPWPNPALFRNLRTLRLRGSGSDYLPTMPGFLDALESCTFLEQLFLRNSGPAPLTGLQPPIVYLDPTRLVQLSRLRLLHTTSLWEVNNAHLLAHLAMPRGTHVYVASVNRVLPSVSGPLFGLPRDCSNLHFLNAMSCVRLTHFGNSLTRVSAWHEAKNFGKTTPCFWTNVVPDRTEPDVVSTLATLLRLGHVFQSAHLSVLELRLPLQLLRQVTASDWTTILSSFPSLKTLCLKHQTPKPEPRGTSQRDSQYVQPLLEALIGSPATSDSRLVPSLTTLRLSKVRLSAPHSIADGLLQCVKSRAKPDDPLSFQLLVGDAPWPAS